MNGDPPTDPTVTLPSNPPEPPGATQAPTPAPAPPPAAKIVLEATKTEREVALERTLKERETRLAELEDENRVLKTPPNPPTPARLPPRKRSWLDGATFFDEE